MRGWIVCWCWGKGWRVGQEATKGGLICDLDGTSVWLCELYA